MIASKKLFSITYLIFMLGTIVAALIFLPSTSSAAWTCVPNYNLNNPFENCVESSVDDVVGPGENNGQPQVSNNTHLVAGSGFTLSNQDRREFLLKILPLLEKMFR